MPNSFSFNVEKTLLGQSIVFNQRILVNNGIIESIHDCQKGSPSINKGLLIPGLIDTQVNGGGGFLFNQTPDVETLQKIGKAHQQFGTTGWLPTFITDSTEKMKLAATAIAEAIKIKTSGILGVHFEGPFLSLEKKGIHAGTFIRQFEASDLDFFKRKDLGQIVLTVAPEAISIEHIKALVNSGVIVSLGHSNATIEQAQAAFDSGATGVTHLFNAMSQFNARAPGLVGASLINKNIFSGLILDGIHVAPEAVKVAIQSCPNLMLVTDAMPPAASDVSVFEYWGEKYFVNGNQLTDINGRLAGSNLTMGQALINCETLLGLTIVDAVKMASTNPANFLKMTDSYGELAVGKKASMVLVDEQTKVLSSWVDGYQVI